MDYINNINEYLANRIVDRNKSEIVEFCVNNGIDDSDEFIEQFDVTEFDDFTMLLEEEIADAAMHYSDAYEILRDYGWLTNWDDLTDYIGGGNWYNLSQVAEAALMYEYNADEQCMEDLKELIFIKIPFNKMFLSLFGI